MSTALATSKSGLFPTKHVYDVIIVGSQLGGLWTALLLAKHGIKVLWVEHDGQATHYEVDGWQLPHGPFLVPSLKRLTGFEEFLVELGILPTLQRLVQMQSIQLLKPKQWLDVPHVREARSKEFQRALGEQAADQVVRRFEAAIDSSSTADSYFASKPDLPPEGFFARWKFRRHARKFPGLEVESPFTKNDLDELFRGLLPFVVPVENPRSLSIARTLGQYAAGVFTTGSGRESVTDALRERARELGVDVIDSKQSVEAIVFEGSAPVGIRLVRHDTTYRGAFVVAACDLHTLEPLVPDAKKKAIAKLSEQLPEARTTLVVNAIVPEEAIPPGMNAVALIASADPDFPHVLAMQMPAVRRTDASVSHVDGMTVLTLAAVMPANAKVGGEPAIRKQIDRLWHAVDDVLPFTRAHAELESSPWFDDQRVTAGVADLGTIFALPTETMLGVVGVAPTAFHRRLLLAGRSVLPGLGFEGEVMTAQRVSRMIEAALKKSDPLKSRSASA